MKDKGFTQREQLVVTVILLGISTGIIYGLYRVIVWAIGRIGEAL